MREICEKAYAKLNLSLDVTGRRSDGYHDMCMVMQTVSLCDDVRMRFRSDGKITVSTDLHYLPCDERNIAYKAASVFLNAVGRPEQGLDISIKKHIPVCAGMGGGSADGAAVLRGLNSALGSPMSSADLERLGLELGSDIPFCICGGTALAKGRGELLTPLSPLPECHIVICKPRFSVSTPALFAELDKRDIALRPDTDAIVSALAAADLRAVSQKMCNVFESALPRYKSEVDDIKAAMASRGALGCLMTGTGSVVFGVFDSSVKAFEAKAHLRRRYREVYLAIPKSRLSF